MRHWVIAVALVACGGKQSATQTPQVASGPSCAEVGVHAAPLFRADDATTDRIAASLAGHCDVDQWTTAARQCVLAASSHDALAHCSYKHLTREQDDKVSASLLPLVKPAADPEPEPAAIPTGGTQAEIAARSAAEGQTLFAQGKFAEASSQYMDAVARVPEARYFYLLGQSRHREGKFAEALTAVDAADRSSPNAALAVQIRELRAHIKRDALAQRIQLE